MPDDVVIEAFMAAVRQRFEAEEFEELMSGAVEGRCRIDDNLDLIDLMMRDWGDESVALRRLKASRALESLQGSHADLWEQAVMGVVVDAS